MQACACILDSYVQNCNHETGSEETACKISTLLFFKVEACDFLEVVFF